MKQLHIIVTVHCFVSRFLPHWRCQFLELPNNNPALGLPSSVSSWTLPAIQTPPDKSSSLFLSSHPYPQFDMIWLKATTAGYSKHTSIYTYEECLCTYIHSLSKLWSPVSTVLIYVPYPLTWRRDSPNSQWIVGFVL